MSRQDFTTDALFGMPGVPQEVGACVMLGEGTAEERFQHPHTEATYQVWLRGYNAKALAVRDKLNHMADLPNTSAAWEELGCTEPREIGLLLQQLQKTGFLPKRPGD